MEDVFKIGDKLKALRLDEEYTQEFVAINLGVKPSTYSDYERGVHQVPSEVVIKATEFFKVGLEHFYSLRGTVNITMNDQPTNGYVEQLYTVPVDVIERMFQRSEERWEGLTKQLMELLARAMK